MRLARSCNRGFTITEIMVGLVIVGIIMAAALPNLARSNRNHRLVSAAAEVEGALTRARSAAVTTRDPVRVTVDAALNQLVLEQDTTDDGDFDRMMWAVNVDDDIDISNVTFNGGNTVIFDARGAPDNPGLLLLANGGESGQRILVSAGSGAVSVKSVPLYGDEQTSPSY
jgi:prepilin-type N-terminal cleavage/methylation domain-containing protein